MFKIMTKINIIFARDYPTLHFFQGFGGNAGEGLWRLKTGGQRKKRSWSFGDLGLPNADLSHAVLVLLAEAAQLPLEVNANPDVQVSTVANVWHHPEKATNFFVLLGGDGVLQVEECLFPVSVSGIGSR